MYARVFNDLRPGRQRFVVLYFVRRHNALMDAGDTDHLTRLNGEWLAKQRKKRAPKGYGCNTKRSAAANGGKSKVSKANGVRKMQAMKRLSKGRRS